MTVVTRLSDLINPEKQATQEARLRDAYVRLFNGKGTPEDASLVLIDLMQVSGYHTYLEPPAGEQAASAAALQELNGSRRVGGRIMRMLNYPLGELNKLQQAIIAENAEREEEFF